MYTNTIRSVTIGSFDGIHLAHQALIDKAEAVVVIERFTGYLTPGFRRCDHINKPCFFYDFEKIRRLSPQTFLEKLQENFPALEKIVIGFDFTFGKHKAADAAWLQAHFEGEVTVVPEISLDGIAVHSRTIKELLQAGDIEGAHRLLGRRYRIYGRIVTGQGLGGRALVPTLNLQTEGYQLPREGVYATRTYIDGVWYASVSFIGHRVTTDGSFAVETHLIDTQIDGAVTGQIGIEFIAFLRENKKFETIEALKAQIERDIIEAKAWILESEK